jgi:hypothetical protein
LKILVRRNPDIELNFGIITSWMDQVDADFLRLKGCKLTEMEYIDDNDNAMQLCNPKSFFFKLTLISLIQDILYREVEIIQQRRNYLVGIINTLIKILTCVGKHLRDLQLDFFSSITENFQVCCKSLHDFIR